MDTIQTCLHDRIEVQHVDTNLTILATNGWEKGENASSGHIL